MDAYDAFGRAIANIGDFDSDGVIDIVVGAYHDDDGGYNTGAVYILFLNSDGTVKDSQKISSTEGNFQNIIDSGDCWGNAITSLDDLDGDGITDIAVGAHKNYSPGTEMNRVGAVHILFLNSDGTVKHSQEISDTKGDFNAIGDNDIFGIDLTNLSDLDGDGITDIAVGAQGDSENGFSQGAVYILFLNSDGTVKSYQKINSDKSNFQVKLDDSDMFGSSVNNIGDLNNDGVIDIAVGVPGDDDTKELMKTVIDKVVGAPYDNDGGQSQGAVYILFLNSDGTVKDSQKISSTEGNFQNIIDSGDCWGNAITSLDDLDGDGITDIAVGAHKNYSPGTEMNRVGAVHILFLNSDGTVKHSQEISDTKGDFNAIGDNDIFGIDLTNLSDLDGDGITDIAVGAQGDSENGFSQGAVYILFLNSDGTVKSYQKINSDKSNFQVKLDDSDMFGSSVNNIGDLNNDGVIDIAVGVPGDDDTKELMKTVIDKVVGAPYDNDGGQSQGAVYILFLNSDGTVKDSQKISSTEGNFRQNLQPSDLFGFSLTNLSDLDGDGITDIAVGSPHRYYYDAESSPLHILLLEKDGKVKSFETLPQENNIRVNSDIFYFLGIIIILAIIAVLVIKIKFKNRIKILKK